MENKNFTIIAKTFFGLENVLAEELKSIGAQNIEPINRAVSYTGNNEVLYKSNLCLRTALKVLKPIFNFTVKNEDDLYKKIKEYEWDTILSAKKTLAVDVQVNSDLFRNSRFVTYRIKDAVVDYFKDKYNRRPFINIDNPHIQINVFIYQDKCTVSIDSSGDSLHRRNYRIRDGIAPLNEVLAAGLVLLTGWDKKSTLYDPMCGSGTIPIEAAMIACNIAPNIKRTQYSFQGWNDYDSSLWNKIVDEARNNIVEHDGYIYASDISELAYSQTLENVNNAFHGDDYNIKLSIKPIDKVAQPKDAGIVIINPPYGERMRTELINNLYSNIGTTLKHNFAGFDAWIISSNFEALRNVGLHTSRKITLYNGKLECKFQNYKLYEGSKKLKKQEEI